MAIAVIYATAQGSTCEIAEFIADDLAGRGAAVEFADVEHAPELSCVDAVILGSAVHNMALLRSINEYVRHHASELNALPVWVFSVGLVPALRVCRKRLPHCVIRSTRSNTPPSPDNTNGPESRCPPCPAQVFGRPDALVVDIRAADLTGNKSSATVRDIRKAAPTFAWGLSAPSVTAVRG
ncbi:flavodoxin domain-containing protein [Nocardia miyunensis]|uniref:flavodoxin domain-containing protein n=1 Tax=Nocardia miyunensis TaxID=282684 RepID=UPI00082F5AD2|nr:flavodoxin domain-containing protein [Nocardia miyunensis]